MKKKKVGRKPIFGKPMTSTERSNRRYALVRAKAVELDVCRAHLSLLHHDLLSAGEPGFADRVASIMARSILIERKVRGKRRK